MSNASTIRYGSGARLENLRVDWAALIAGLCDALATALMVAGKDGAKWFGMPELASYSAWVVNRNENTAWSVND